MSAKVRRDGLDKEAVRPQKSRADVPDVEAPARSPQISALFGRAVFDSASLRPPDVLQLQNAFGNRAVSRLLTTAKQGRAVPPQSDAESGGVDDKTGLAPRLKAGLEELSGLPMDDVRVHYNSSSPARLQALAYTKGTEIHIAPGQEKHIAHEAWHVVQQKQGRVAPTIELRGEPINDSASLEREADLMGARVLTRSHAARVPTPVAPPSSTPLAQTIQRITREEVPGLQEWWDAWLERAILRGYIKRSEKAEWVEKGHRHIEGAVVDKGPDKKTVQVSLDKLLRDAVPVTEGEHIPIEFRVPDTQATGPILRSLDRDDFIKRLDEEAGPLLMEMSHTLHHKISDAALRALASRLSDAISTDKNALEFYEVLTTRARYEAPLTAKSSKKITAPPSSGADERSLYKILTNMPVNLEVGPRAGVLRDADNDPGSLFDASTVPVEGEEVESASSFRPQLSINADPVPWNPRRRRMSLRSEHLFQISLIAEKIYVNKKYVPTTEEWAVMTRSLRAAVEEHNRILAEEGQTNVKLTQPRREQWVKDKTTGKYLRKHTEEGLIYAHDHKREIGDAGDLSEKEKREIATRKEQEEEERRRRWREQEARRAELEKQAVELWLKNEVNLARVHKELLGSYASLVGKKSVKLLLAYANTAPPQRGKKDKKWVQKYSAPASKRDNEDWVLLVAKTAKEMWTAEKKPGLDIVEDGGPGPGFNAELTLAAYSAIMADFSEHYSELVPEGEAPIGVVHPEVEDVPQIEDKSKKWAAARSKLLEEILLNQEAFQVWLATNEIKVAPNSGSGCNCLIISLLQHATGNYASEHAAKARTLREALIGQFPQIVLGQMLHSDDPAYVWLVNRINEEYGISMNPVFVSPDAEARPFVHPVNQIGENPVVIWQQGNHYEALYT
ncbi:MAG TPA: DUF4157 domain-containing protein [Pyrinomonadaceae bacterium]|nr:DUF4157 domain-containing protein [Pyrinomonadaceae bacterium]